MRTTTDPKDATIQARLPADLFEEFKKIAESEERTASQAIRLLVRDFVEQHKAKPRNRKASA